MASSFGGKLGQQLLSTLLRDISSRRLSGVLRLSRDKVRKIIVFNSGQPISAFSSISSEQLDSRLIRDGRTTLGLVGAVKRINPDPMTLGAALVEKGLVSADVMSRTAGELSEQIILSVFDWTDGSYAFEEGEPPTPPFLQTSLADLVVQGVRQASANEAMADRMCPPDKSVARAELDPDHFASSARLNSIESYVLSQITTTTPLQEIATLSGLPEEQVKCAVCVLLEAGLLSAVDAPAPPPPPPPVPTSAPVQAPVQAPTSARPQAPVQAPTSVRPQASVQAPTSARPQAPAQAPTSARVQAPAQAPTSARVQAPVQAPAKAAAVTPRSSDPLLEGVARKLRQFENASHYDVLGVDKLATTNTINAAFEQLTEMFQAHRRENPDRADLLRLIDELFNKIKLAHDTLSDPFKRRDYDRPVGATPPPFDPRLSERVAWPDDSRPRAQAVTPGAPRKPVPIPFNIPTPVAPKPVARPEPVIERNQATASKDRTLQMPARKAIPIPEIQMPVAPKNGNGAIERGGAETTRRNPPLPPRPNTGPLTRPPAVLSPEEVARLRNAPTNNVEQALHCYRQGKARLERREIDIAEHLFREAVRLDASQPDYHYQLAVILAIRAQARHEHMHHEGCHVTCKLGGTLVSNPKVRYEAERHFLRAHEMDPANPVIALKLGQLYKDARLLKKAELFLKTAIMLDGTNYVAQQELDDLYETESDDGSSGSLSQR